MPTNDPTADLDWNRIERDLDGQGWATTGPLLTGVERDRLVAAYDDDRLFRNRVIMARHGFGRGEYRYFDYPLPPLIQEFRRVFYGRLIPIANRWRAALGQAPLPLGLDAFLELCHAGGQSRPTPLLLRYGAGDFNCLHQDLYGEHVFPLQAAVLLSEPGRDFIGGELVLTEQRPRMQSRVSVVPLHAGEGVIFAVNHRPVEGVRGPYRVAMRHGVSQLRSGSRHTLGIIFHDAA
jgi:hypothetical protein